MPAKWENSNNAMLVTYNNFGGSTGRAFEFLR